MSDLWTDLSEIYEDLNKINIFGTSSHHKKKPKWHVVNGIPATDKTEELEVPISFEQALAETDEVIEPDHDFITSSVRQVFKQQQYSNAIIEESIRNKQNYFTYLSDKLGVNDVQPLPPSALPNEDLEPPPKEQDADGLLITAAAHSEIAQLNDVTSRGGGDLPSRSNISSALLDPDVAEFIPKDIKSLKSTNKVDKTKYQTSPLKLQNNLNPFAEEFCLKNPISNLETPVQIPLKESRKLPNKSYPQILDSRSGSELHNEKNDPALSVGNKKRVNVALQSILKMKKSVTIPHDHKSVEITPAGVSSSIPMDSFKSQTDANLSPLERVEPIMTGFAKEDEVNFSLPMDSFKSQIDANLSPLECVEPTLTGFSKEEETIRQSEMISHSKSSNHYDVDKLDTPEMKCLSWMQSNNAKKSGKSQIQPVQQTFDINSLISISDDDFILKPKNRNKKAIVKQNKTVTNPYLENEKSIKDNIQSTDETYKMLCELRDQRYKLKQDSCDITSKQIGDKQVDHKFSSVEAVTSSENGSLDDLANKTIFTVGPQKDIQQLTRFEESQNSNSDIVKPQELKDTSTVSLPNINDTSSEDIKSAKLYAENMSHSSTSHNMEPVEQKLAAPKLLHPSALNANASKRKCPQTSSSTSEYQSESSSNVPSPPLCVEEKSSKNNDLATLDKEAIYQRLIKMQLENTNTKFLDIEKDNNTIWGLISKKIKNKNKKK